MKNKICIVYTNHKLGDLIWQLPYIKSIHKHHREKVDLLVRKDTQAKDILKDLDYLDNIFYNDFRKGLFYWIDVLKIYKIFQKGKYDYVYILDKVNKPAIAAKLARVKNIIAPGIGNQKRFVTNKNILNDKDWKLSYSEQSQKLLKINSIIVNQIYPEINIDTKKFEIDNQDLLLKGKKIAFGVDSYEDYKMWQESNFIELANLLHGEKLFDYIYLICGKKKSYIARNIIRNSGKNYFIDCSSKNLGGIILALKNSNFFIGNNSGPMNLAAALNIKSFGLIANSPLSELKFSKVICVTPPGYSEEKINKDRETMKSITASIVLKSVMNKI